ncbi:HdeD family acid-resistance protein [Haloarcula salinisoli]|uniref:DUF308 domain-containing protein n=1 Tax=Haloarcula salinisoli TaxID=2487746 RepID=A0A8J7YAH6_9EURY|nr:DUF308 domain-containing protein [Halomicroarcula salinisoli]MBX0286037.1 DUF308 domain-containing protein [Halomicroarcula salinisoli]MBX0302475.1 DUF308 domain-containing protein [Halomicroarcula salinisoli]
MATEASSSDSMQAQLQQGGVVGGVLLAILGLLALVTPFITGLALSILLGAALVVGALVHVAAAFSAGSARGVVWQVILGIAYGLVGISILANPLLGLTTLTVLVIAFFAVEGIVQLVWAVSGAGSPLWLGLSGAISLLLAGMLLVGFPATALWAVGVLFGVDLLVTGISMAMHGRTQESATTAEAPAETMG